MWTSGCSTKHQLHLPKRADENGITMISAPIQSSLLEDGKLTKNEVLGTARLITYVSI